MEGKQEKRKEEHDKSGKKQDKSGKKDEDKSSKKEEDRCGKKDDKKKAPLMTLNHVSRVCKNAEDSKNFYTKVLGFVEIDRPEAFDTFDGAWLFNYGVGIHLVQTKDGSSLPSNTKELDPMDNHISFQCEDMEAIEQKLKDNDVKYIKRAVEDDEYNTTIDQLFFNDPDGFMIEMCNCENLKLVPAGSMGQIQLPDDKHNPPVELENKEAICNCGTQQKKHRTKVYGAEQLWPKQTWVSVIIFSV